jgi:hypothetical protein
VLVVKLQAGVGQERPGKTGLATNPVDAAVSGNGYLGEVVIGQG